MARLIPLALLLLAACHLGVEPVHENLGKIEGSVRLLGLESHAGIQVEVSGPVKVNTETDAHGAFVADGLMPGTYAVVARSEAVVEPWTMATVKIPAEGGAIAAPELTLTPAGRLSGTVALAGRTDHTDVQVVVRATGAVTTTDAAGNYTFEAVPIGVHELLAASSGFVPAVAGEVTVRRGELTDVPAMTLSAAEVEYAGMIAGKARLAGETSHEGVVVIAQGPGSGSATTAADGSFEIGGLPDGTYELLLSAPSTAEGLQSTTVTVTSGQGTVPEVTFQPMGRLAGKLAIHRRPVPDYGQVAGAPSLVAGDETHEGVLVTARGVTGDFHARSLADGAFEFGQLPTGSYLVTFTRYGFDAPAKNVTVVWREWSGLEGIELCPAGQKWNSTECAGDLLAAYSAPVTATRQLEKYDQPMQSFLPLYRGMLMGVELALAPGEAYEAEDELEIIVRRSDWSDGQQSPRARIPVATLPAEPAALELSGRARTYVDLTRFEYFLDANATYTVEVQPVREVCGTDGRCQVSGTACQWDWECEHVPQYRVGYGPDDYAGGRGLFGYETPSPDMDLAFKVYVLADDYPAPR